MRRQCSCGGDLVRQGKWLVCRVCLERYCPVCGAPRQPGREHRCREPWDNRIKSQDQKAAREHGEARCSYSADCWHSIHPGSDVVAPSEWCDYAKGNEVELCPANRDRSKVARE